MKTYRILDPHAVKIGNRSLAGGIVTEEQLGDRVASLLEQGAIELIEPKDAKKKPDGGPGGKP